MAIFEKADYWGLKDPLDGDWFKNGHATRKKTKNGP